MTTTATYGGGAVVRLPRARLVTTSGALGWARAAVEEKGGGGARRAGAAAGEATAPHTSVQWTQPLPAWVHQPGEVERKAAVRGNEPPGRAAWPGVGEVLRALAALLDLGPTPRATVAEAALEVLRTLLGGGLLPAPVVLAEPHDFLLTACYFGSPTSAPCADLLHYYAGQLADALDVGRDPSDLAELLLDTAVTLDGYRTATVALARARDTAPAARPPGGAAP